MNPKKSVQERIREERAKWETVSPQELWDSVLMGQEEAARGAIVYFSTESTFKKRFEYIERKCQSKSLKLEGEEGRRILRFLLNVALDLKSFPAERKILTWMEEEELQSYLHRIIKALIHFHSTHSDLATFLTSKIKTNTIARLKAEGISNILEAERAMEFLWGNGLEPYIENLTHDEKKSNLRDAARKALQGSLHTEIGNDYAEYLDTVIRLGGSFATTNPVLIKLAWDLDPAYWNPKVDQVILSLYSRSKLTKLFAGSEEAISAAIEKVNSHVTISVVEGNCRLLRPLFLLSEGKQGYVSLQVNPKAHHDSAKMVEEAVFIYKQLEKQLGGVPNVVIKVPSTAAGLQAAEQLTSEGIGVTVTLTFSLFQSVSFAPVLQRGKALVSYIALMNGRLAFPVRDELRAKGVVNGAEAARWAGVEVARKAAHRLYSGTEKGGLGVDPEKVKIMIASLRVYDDWIPDISELWGIPLITIFPNVRRSYDSHPRPLNVDSLHGITPEKDVEILLKSEIFKQAWWVPENGSMGKPERVLSLEQRDAEAVANWKPVHETLTQFIGMYQEMGSMVRERMRFLTTN